MRMMTGRLRVSPYLVLLNNAAAAPVVAETRPSPGGGAGRALRQSSLGVTGAGPAASPYGTRAYPVIALIDRTGFARASWCFGHENENRTALNLRPWPGCGRSGNT